MTNSIGLANAGMLAKFRRFFTPRDIFLHDGKSLRRFTIGSGVQKTAAFAAFFVLAWSVFASFQAVSAMTGDVARMEAQVAQMEADVAAMQAQARDHAAQLERGQAFLTGLLSGEADADELAQTLPQQSAAPRTPAARAVVQTYSQAEDRQAQLADRARNATRERYRETAQVVRRLGLNPSRFHRAEGFGVGGPLEEIEQADNADPRFRELFASWRQLEQLEQGVVAIPSARPINASVNFTSGFGIRSDPFRGRAAMHGGIDLAGSYGTPIYATADGIVARSEWNNGGYGNLVEINHGQGIQTRYGHMSRLIARPGQRVRRGELIGLMGSTGRSTGNHLHYEVRIDGRAVNPVPFMQSTDMLAALQRRVQGDTPIAPVAIGGPARGRR